MAELQANEKVFCARLQRARISELEVREYDLVVRIESSGKAGFYLQFENSVRITIGGERVEWMPEGSLAVDLLQVIV